MKSIVHLILSPVVFWALVVHSFGEATEEHGLEDNQVLLQVHADVETRRSMGTGKFNQSLPSQHSDVAESRKRYLGIIRDTLTGTALRTPSVTVAVGDGHSLSRTPFNALTRWQGIDWCDYCFTMAGGARVQNVWNLVETTISEGIPGDFLEAGTWRGGCSIMARTVQKELGEGEHRRTYVCDSFSGLPRASNSKDGDYWNDMHFLEVSQSEVENNFDELQALDENVLFRKGYFSESLPKVRKEFQENGRQLAVLRGDGDMYESYMDILFNLYEFVPVGGYFICDDCPSISVAEQAITDFRNFHGITDPLVRVEGSITGSYWRKGSPTAVNYSHYLMWNSTRTFSL